MITKPKKYTQAFVQKEVSELLKALRKDKDIVLLSELLEDKSYGRQRFSEWSKEFSKISEISDTMEKIKEILETRVNRGGLMKQLDSRMVVFNLKNNYGWQEKAEVTNTNLNLNNDLSSLTDEELNARILYLQKRVRI